MKKSYSLLTSVISLVFLAVAIGATLQVAGNRAAPSALSQLETDVPTKGKGVSPQPSGWIPAPTITIASDSDWVSGPSKAWINGSGTWANPYCISNLTINGGGTAPYCISISHTRKPFIVANCTILNGKFAGIYLANATNGTLVNNTCTGDSIGIQISSVVSDMNFNNTCANNTCKSNVQCGIFIFVADNNTCSGNNCSLNPDGIQVSGSNNVNVLQNNCSVNTHAGIYFNTASASSTLAGNNCTGNKYGICLNATGTGNNCTGNNCTGNTNSSICLTLASNYNNLSGNNCSWS